MSTRLFEQGLLRREAAGAFDALLGLGALAV
ncbi:MAG: hypothetical protein ACI9WU_005033, partial [Myxococcota bacterium]